MPSICQRSRESAVPSHTQPSRPHAGPPFRSRPAIGQAEPDHPSRAFRCAIANAASAVGRSRPEIGAHSRRSPEREIADGCGHGHSPAVDRPGDVGRSDPIAVHLKRISARRAFGDDARVGHADRHIRRVAGIACDRSSHRHPHDHSAVALGERDGCEVEIRWAGVVGFVVERHADGSRRRCSATFERRGCGDQHDQSYDGDVAQRGASGDWDWMQQATPKTRGNPRARWVCHDGRCDVRSVTSDANRRSNDQPDLPDLRRTVRRPPERHRAEASPPDCPRHLDLVPLPRVRAPRRGASRDGSSLGARSDVSA